MQRLATRFACLVGLFLLHSSAKGEETQWIRVASPHLEMFTTAHADTAAQALDELESLRLYFRSAVLESATAPARLRIVAFSSGWEYQAFRLNSYSPAYFVGGSGQGTIVLGRLAKENFPALRHEYVHALVHESGRRLPLWLSEGLAEQLAGVDAARVRLRCKLLKGQGLMSIRELTSVTSAYRDEDAARRFYAESWALTHMLLTETPYRDHTRAFLTSGSSLQEVLAAAGRTEEQLQQDLGRHIGKLKPVSPWQGTDGVRVKCTVEPAGEIAVGLTLARLQEQAGDPVGARTRLAGLPEQARRQPGYWGLLGDLAMLDSTLEQARYCYEKAMELGSADVRLLTRLAMLERGRKDEVPVLERLVALSPADDEAKLALSSHYLNQRRWPEALAQLRQVRQASPEREEFYRQAVSLAESHLEPFPVNLSTR